MNKKILMISFILISIIAIGTVFAQVCLGPNAARVVPQGSSVRITNTMDEDINVEIQFDLMHHQNPNFKVGSDSIMVFVSERATETIELPEFAKYTGYDVFACSR